MRIMPTCQSVEAEVDAVLVSSCLVAVAGSSVAAACCCGEGCSLLPGLPLPAMLGLTSCCQLVDGLLVVCVLE